MAAVSGGMDSQQSIVTGGGAMPANPDFRADSAAEAQGRLQTEAVQDLKGTVSQSLPRKAKQWFCDSPRRPGVECAKGAALT